jgi:centrosomal protein CEP135
MLMVLQDARDENKVLGDALRAAQKAVNREELSSSQIREDLVKVLETSDDNAKTKLIVTLFDKVERLATRLSSVSVTPRSKFVSRVSDDDDDSHDAVSLRRELHEALEELRKVSAERDQIEQAFRNTAGDDVHKLRKQLKAAQDAKIAALADAETFEVERNDAIAEVERMRAMSDGQRVAETSAGGRSDERLAELESLLGEAQNAINLLSDDREKLLARLRDAEQAKASNGTRPDVVAAQNAARAEAEAANDVAFEAEQELETQRELASRRADEIEQLKSIVSEIDGQRESLAQKLRVAYASLREVESKRDQSRFEGSATEKILVLENECGRLQDEADTLAEALDEARERAMREGASAEEARRLAATAEAKIYSAAQARDAAVARLRALEDQVHDASERERNLAMEAAQYREELRVATDDLAAMTKEQQVVNAELVKALSERDNAWAELREAKSAQSSAGANAQAKQKEVDDVVKAYQELNAENQRIAADLDDMERDMRRAQAALETSESRITQANERAKAAEAESKAYASDLQAYQCQVDNLTQLLENSAKAKVDESDSIEGLKTKLEASNAMLFDMERAKEMARRETAAAEANLLVVRSRLTDVQGDSESLKHKLKLETNRVRELESLVSALRTSENQGGGQGSDVLRERINVLQEQNDGLTRQVETFNEQRKAFETELERLRGVIEGSAGITPSSPSSRPNTRALIDAEAKIDELSRDVDRLSKSLKDAQEEASAMQAKLDTAENVALSARKEAHAMARREAETRAELQGVRSELSIARDALREAMNDAPPANNEAVRLQQRLQDAERRAMAAETSLARLETEQSPVSQASAEEARILRQENSRLLGLLSRTNEELNEARRLIDEQGYTERADDLLVREQVRAAEERTRRVEADFEQLVQQMRQMEGGAGSELLERLQELEEENEELRESLAGTEEATLEMQQELARISEEYAALASTLTETIQRHSEESP